MPIKPNRICQRGCCNQSGSRVLWQRRDARADQLTQGGRDRRCLTGMAGSYTLADGARELEREEGVATRCLVHGAERRSGKHDAESLPEERVNLLPVSGSTSSSL